MDDRDDSTRRDDVAPALPSFTRDGYRQLLTRLRDADYRPATFETVRPGSRDLIVRHDVDLSLEAAVELAEIERGLGVTAIYFVMVSNSFYNIFSIEGRRQVARLGALGHRIGLHFDVSAYEFTDPVAEYSAAAAIEMKLLSTLVSNPVEIIAFHNPRKELVNSERPAGGLPHTYEPRFFKQIAYVADSGGAWRFGGPFEREAFKNGTAIHLVTHPIWWVRDAAPPGPEHVLEDFADRHRQRLEENLGRGFRAYRQFLEARTPVAGRS